MLNLSGKGNVEVNAPDESPQSTVTIFCYYTAQAGKCFQQFFFYFTGPTGHEEETLDFQETAMAPSCPPYLNL